MSVDLVFLERKFDFNNFGNAHYHTVQTLLTVTTGLCHGNWGVINLRTQSKRLTVMDAFSRPFDVAVRND